MGCPNAHEGDGGSLARRSGGGCCLQVGVGGAHRPPSLLVGSLRLLAFGVPSTRVRSGQASLDHPAPSASHSSRSPGPWERLQNAHPPAPQTCSIDTSSSARRPADGTEQDEADPTALLTGHWPQPSQPPASLFSLRLDVRPLHRSGGRPFAVTRPNTAGFPSRAPGQALPSLRGSAYHHLGREAFSAHCVLRRPTLGHMTL